MPQDTLVEDRLSTLEREVADLKSRVHSPAGNWLHQVSGSMADQPEFDQILKLGQAIRQADKVAE